jgi:hypothetical protein
VNTLIVLRLIHIVVGAFWVGAIVFVAWFLLPALRAAGPAGGAVMRQVMQVRHLHVYMVAATWLTLLSGAALAYRDAGPLGFGWFTLGAGRVYGVGALLGLIATVIGLSVNAPTATRLAVLAARLERTGLPPSQEDQAQRERLQERLGRAASLVAVLMLLAVSAMAVARYVA